MAKQLPAGTSDSPWKRLPYGANSPGMANYPTGRAVTAAQQLIRDVYNAANQKTLRTAYVADLGVLQSTVAGRGSYLYDFSGNRRDWTTNSTTVEPGYTASEPTIGGKACFTGQGTRWFFNRYASGLPSTAPIYSKSVCRLDSWPPGGRCWYGSTANRGGVYTNAPDSVLLTNGVISGLVDQPLTRWGVLTSQLKNSNAAYPNGDFIQFGSSLNRASGINCGNTNTASGGKFAINTGGQGITGSEACQFVWAATLTDAESKAVDDLLNAYYGGGLLIYSSAGNIRSAGVGWLGSSQTYYTQGAAVNFQGARYAWYNAEWTTNNYPIYTTGHTSSGNWAQPANDGISGQGINVDSGGVNPGTGNAVATAYFTAGGASPNAGVGRYAFINLELGSADVAAGAYVAGTTDAALLVIAQTLANANPRARIGINTIAPQFGDPPAVVNFSNAIRSPGGIWDQFDALYPLRPCVRVDLNYAVSAGTGLYIPANYVDTVHLNQTGQFLWANDPTYGLIATAAPWMNLATQY